MIALVVTHNKGKSNVEAADEPLFTAKLLVQQLRNYFTFPVRKLVSI